MVCELSKKALFPLSIGQQASKTERLFSSSFSSTGCLKNNDSDMTNFNDLDQISKSASKICNLRSKSTPRYTKSIIFGKLSVSVSRDCHKVS